MVEWLQCFSIYMAVIARKQPEHIPNLLGYQNLIIDWASHAVRGWQLDRIQQMLQTNAATGAPTTWARIDSTHWNLAFSVRAKGSCCRHCFSLTHPSMSSVLAPVEQSQPSTITARTSIHRNWVCMEWNDTLSPYCSFTPCKYEHLCGLCVTNHAVSNKNHKVIYCPNTQPQRMNHAPTPPTFVVSFTNRSGLTLRVVSWLTSNHITVASQYHCYTIGYVWSANNKIYM